MTKQNEGRPSVRVAHISDVHLTTRKLGWAIRDLHTKRVSGWFHLNALGRGKHFRFAHEIMAALDRDMEERRPDHVVFTGDATALGFASEMQHAASVLLKAAQEIPGMAVPGNHDYYTPRAVLGAGFEKEFQIWQNGLRVESEIYPFAQDLGPVWLIGVNSSTSNLRPWDASGEVGFPQRTRLRRLLSHLSNKPRILVTHYPVALSDGMPEHRWRGLRDLREVLAIAAEGGISVWLHGHRHRHYFRPVSANTPLASICAGSTTTTGSAGYFEYQITVDRLCAQRRNYDRSEKRFRDAEAFELPFVTK